MMRRLTLLLTIAIAAVIAAGAYRIAQSQMRADVYHQRLKQVGQAYRQLADTYNQVVKHTAVTELLVENQKLCVVVRNVAGLIKKIDTPYDPSGEIYVDYVVAGGRLWIRRVYDSDTPPRNAIVIDDALAQVDWKRQPNAYGKAVYRSLTPGRWAVTVTGNGSLGLAQSRHPAELEPSPPVQDYKQLQSELAGDLDSIGPGAVLYRFISPGG